MEKINSKRINILKIELLNLSDLNIDTEAKCNIYSSFDIARKEGIKELNRKIKKIEKSQKMKFNKMLSNKLLDYKFEIIVVEDLDYAENFDTRYEELKNNFNQIKPTHKVFLLDYEGNITNVFYEYRVKNTLFKKIN